MHEVKICEEALKLTQWIEQDNEGQSIMAPTDNKIEDKLEQLQNSLMQLSFQKNHLWCTNFHMEVHAKETHKLKTILIKVLEEYKLRCIGVFVKLLLVTPQNTTNITYGIISQSGVKFGKITYIPLRNVHWMGKLNLISMLSTILRLLINIQIHPHSVEEYEAEEVMEDAEVIIIVGVMVMVEDEEYCIAILASKRDIWRLNSP